jgi:hypothetical protein
LNLVLLEADDNLCFDWKPKFYMSIYGAAIALNLALNSSTAIVLNATTYTDKVGKPNQVAQTILTPLDQYDDGIQKGREQLDRLIKIVRSYPKFNARQKALGVAKLYTQRAEELDKLISGYLNHTNVSEDNKLIILQRWKTERDSLKKMANQEIEPHLTAKEKAFRAFLSNPENIKKLQEAAKRREEEARRRREDAEKLYDILPYPPR